ncbi:hypothetical protein BGZ52_010684 [Haplosporangium bisporale]|nr:hypothetical protein BGZ52_010684 [Haplosporangium bisporale]
MENTYSINPVLEAISSSTTLSGDFPPVTYLANKIASQLLQSGEGAQMFDRRCDADCVLNVGQRRYYVHVQMLASRSPTFRRIFDDMIENKAWGDLTDRSTSSQGQSQGGDDMDYSFEGSIEDEDQGSEMDRDLQQRSPPVSPLERSIQPCSIDQLSQSIQHSLHLSSNLIPMSTEDDEEEINPDIYDDGDDDDENSDPDSEEDRYLPELTINLADPEASHFDELLYYLYTGDGPRWQVFFRPDNYIYILQNIAHLNMLTQHVFDICLAFEQTTPPEMHLHGLALQLLHKSTLLRVPMPGGPGPGLGSGILCQDVDPEQ